MAVSGMLYSVHCRDRQLCGTPGVVGTKAKFLVFGAWRGCTGLRDWVNAYSINHKPFGPVQPLLGPRLLPWVA